MEILFIALILTFVGFNVLMMLTFKKVFPSLSDMYYSLPEKIRDPLWFGLFTFWAISTMIIGQSPFLFGAGFGIILVGCAPKFRKDSSNPDNQERKAHIFGAFFSALMSQLYIGVELMLYRLNIASVIMASIISLLVKKNKTYWLEMVCFFSVFLALSNHI